MDSSLWILVANSASAKLYRREQGHLKEIKTFSHPESRLHDRDLVTSGPGKGNQSMGTGAYNLEPHTTPHVNEFNIFAKELSHFLDHERTVGSYKKLIIVANPTFLGILRQALTHETALLIAHEVNRDLTHLSSSDLLQHINKVLP